MHCQYWAVGAPNSADLAPPCRSQARRDCGPSCGLRWSLPPEVTYTVNPAPDVILHTIYAAANCEIEAFRAARIAVIAVTPLSVGR